MAYNHRMSQQFHGTQQHHGKHRKKDDENDALMRLVSAVYLKSFNELRWIATNTLAAR